MILADGRRLHEQSRAEMERWLKKKSRRGGDWPAKLLSDPADLGGILSDAQPTRHSCVSRLSKLEPSRPGREYSRLGRRKLAERLASDSTALENGCANDMRFCTPTISIA